jgi:hypothetical protein
MKDRGLSLISPLDQYYYYLVIVTGNPGVFQGYPYPYPSKPVPPSRVRVLTGQGQGFDGSGSGVHRVSWVFMGSTGLTTRGGFHENEVEKCSRTYMELI